MSPLLPILSLPFTQPAPQLAGLGTPGRSTLRLLAGLPRLCDGVCFPQMVVVSGTLGEEEPGERLHTRTFVWGWVGDPGRPLTVLVLLSGLSLSWLGQEADTSLGPLLCVACTHLCTHSLVQHD